MPIGIIIPICAFALLLRYLIETEATKRAKYTVGGITGASFIIPFGLLQFVPFGGYTIMAVQLAVSIFILFHLKVTSSKSTLE